ncbi:MAG: A/G-specific adenine glycosylase [Pseudomonadales bacterium]|nr:A/G-specific adenine glycosylase [Pseudomonadales bacterium]
MNKKHTAAGTPFSTRVLAWFDRHGRKNLPWQQDPSPYRVWVSEIMLQQTQVATVIPYFIRFMQRFPSVQALAEAPQDQVLHHWTGLGYYARARNLHRAAQIILSDLQGIFPTRLDQLCQLPGIGRSTAGAILALANKQRAPILDGNVKRVLCRYHRVTGWPGHGATQKQLWQLADQYTPTRRCADYTQAIMDLGATLCTRSRPACPRCPLQEDCQALAQGQVAAFPERKPRSALPLRSLKMLMLQTPQGQILLEKRPAQGIWGGLWSFPEIDTAAEPEDFLQDHGLGQSRTIQEWPLLRHSFSHFHLDITPVAISLKKPATMVMENTRWHWYDPCTPAQLGLAAPVKALLARLTPALTPAQAGTPIHSGTNDGSKSILQKVST